MSSTIAVGSRTSGKTTQPANHAGKPTRSSTRMRSRPAATPQPLQPQPARSARLEIIELSSDNENDYGRLEPLSKRKRNRTPQQAPELKDRNEAPDPRRRKQGDDILLDSLRAELNRVTKERDRCKAELETTKNMHSNIATNLKQKVSSTKLDLTELDDAISCEICTVKMYSPATISECGHSFCTQCLFDWFNTTYARHVETHPEFLQQPEPQLPAHLMHLRHDLRYAAQVALFEARLRQRVPQPEYSCPTCRVQVKSQPLQIYTLKDIIHKVARLSGEKDTSNGQTQAGMWDGFFPQN